MKRRNFLKLLLGLCGSAAFAGLVYPLARYLAPLAGESAEKKLLISRKDIPPGEVRKVILSNTPAIVIHHPSRGLLAFTRVCTHLGCLLEYDREKGRLLCPCHAGTFDLDGNVVSGPPPRPLAKIPVKVEGENVVIG